MIFFVFYIDFYIFYNYVKYDAVTNNYLRLFLNNFLIIIIFNYYFKTPILICWKNKIFIKWFFLVFKVLSLLQWRAGIGIFYYCSHPVIMNKFSLSNCFPKVRCVLSYRYYFFCSLILLIVMLEPILVLKNLICISRVVIGM